MKSLVFGCCLDLFRYFLIHFNIPFGIYLPFGPSHTFQAAHDVVCNKWSYKSKNYDVQLDIKKPIDTSTIRCKAVDEWDVDDNDKKVSRKRESLQAIQVLRNADGGGGMSHFPAKSVTKV